jgi:hypothetical protein
LGRIIEVLKLAATTKAVKLAFGLNPLGTPGENGHRDAPSVFAAHLGNFNFDFFPREDSRHKYHEAIDPSYALAGVA